MIGKSNDFLGWGNKKRRQNNIFNNDTRCN